MIEFQCSLTKKLWKYWLAMPKEGLLPESADFFPEEIPSLLPYINIYELVSEDLIRFKLSGTMVTVRDGFDRTGDNYLDLVAPERREKASEAFWAIYQQPCAMHGILEIKQTSGVIKTSEGIGLPMRNSRGGPPLLYYLNQEISDTAPKYEGVASRSEQMNVLQRDFIDIGAGLPDFID